jgi:hypothetical protein
MKRDRRLAGIGSIAFPVFLLAGFIVANPPGGNYHAGDVADFVAKGHQNSVLLSIFLVAISTVGLIAAMAYQCEIFFGPGKLGRIAWGTSLLSAASFLIGYAVVVTPSTSLKIGGGPALDPAVSYTIIQAGFGILLLVGCMMLGIALIALAIGGQTAPKWVRVLSGVAGVLAFFTIAWFPFFGVLIWGLVIGIWLLVSSPGTESADAAQSQAA